MQHNQQYTNQPPLIESEETMSPGYDEAVMQAEQYDSTQPQTPVIDRMEQQIKTLSPEEIAVVAQAFTPQVDAILTKAFGPRIGQLFKSFDAQSSGFEQPAQPGANPMSAISAIGTGH